MFWPIVSYLTVVSIHRSASQVRDLTPEELERFNSWNESSLENLWELSGQFEGDILLDGDDERHGTQNPSSIWKNKEVPFDFTEEFSLETRKLIQIALQDIESKTCIRLRPRIDADVDFVLITANRTGCFSSVGRRGGAQTLNLQQPHCVRNRTIIHEFVHALGFYHQHSATKRDDYVTIVWKNILKGKEKNFRIRTNTTSFGEKYDYASIMHYGAYAFTANKEKTIITKDPNAIIGKQTELSNTDAAKLIKMYNCY